MEEVIKILKIKGFDLIYSELNSHEFQVTTKSYMIWMKNKRYFLFECSVEAMNDFIKDGIELNLNLWLKDLTQEDLKKLIDLGLPDIQSTIREVKLKKLLGS